MIIALVDVPSHCTSMCILYIRLPNHLVAKLAMNVYLNRTLVSLVCEAVSQWQVSTMIILEACTPECGPYNHIHTNITPASTPCTVYTSNL